MGSTIPLLYTCSCKKNVCTCTKYDPNSKGWLYRILRCYKKGIHEDNSSLSKRNHEKLHCSSGKESSLMEIGESIDRGKPFPDKKLVNCDCSDGKPIGEKHFLIKTCQLLLFQWKPFRSWIVNRILSLPILFLHHKFRGKSTFKLCYGWEVCDYFHIKIYRRIYGYCVQLNVALYLKQK